MRLSKVLSIFLCAAMLVVAVGCGGPKTVSNQNTTLNLVYGDRTGVYSGEVNEQNIPNGKGKFTSKNSQGLEWTYEGTFKDGHFDGKGKTSWKDGRVEEGTYVNDRLSGQGKLTVPKLDGTKEVRESNFVAGVPMKAEQIGLNEDAEFADWSYRVTNVEEKGTVGNTPAKGKFIIVTVNELNKSNTQRIPGQVENGHYFFVLVNTDSGNTYSIAPEAMLAIHNQKIMSGNLNSLWYLSQINPGMNAEDIVYVFDVPKDDNLTNLVLLPTDSFGDVSPVKLAS